MSAELQLEINSISTNTSRQCEGANKKAFFSPLSVAVLGASADSAPGCVLKDVQEKREREKKSNYSALHVNFNKFAFLKR